MNWFRKKPGKSVLRPVARWLRARFGAATTTRDSAGHWAAAEVLAADADARQRRVPPFDGEQTLGGFCRGDAV